MVICYYVLRTLKYSNHLSPLKMFTYYYVVSKKEGTELMYQNVINKRELKDLKREFRNSWEGEFRNILGGKKLDWKSNARRCVLNSVTKDNENLQPLRSPLPPLSLPKQINLLVKYSGEVWKTWYYMERGT